MLVWADGEAAAEPAPGVLEPLAASGSIAVGAAATDGLVPVGETGVLVEVPAGAVAAETDLIFIRLPVEGSPLAPAEGDYWWCSLWRVEAALAAELDAPIRLVLPNRRTLTPGLLADGFIVDAAAGEPTAIGPEAPRITGTVAFLGEAVATHLLEPADFGGTLDAVVVGMGVLRAERQRGLVGEEGLPADEALLFRAKRDGGDGEARREAAGGAASQPAAGKAKLCKRLKQQMADWNDAYWDAVEAGDSEGATDAADGYQNNRQSWLRNKRGPDPIGGPAQQ